MSENKMAEVAKLLGIEMNEEFIAKYPKGREVSCILHESSLLVCDTNGLWDADSVLCDLIVGNCKIYKKPWKAELNETYYVPLPNKDTKYEFTIHRNQSLGNDFYLRGLMCRTKDQAVEIAEAMISLARKMQGFMDEEQQDDDCVING